MIVIFNVLWTIFIGVKIPLESIQLNGLEISLRATARGFESHRLRHILTVIVIRSYGSFILPFTPKIGLIKYFSKKMPSRDLFPGWALCIFRSFPHYKSLDLWGYRWNYGLSLQLWVIVGVVGNNIPRTQNRSCVVFHFVAALIAVRYSSRIKA